MGLIVVFGDRDEVVRRLASGPPSVSGHPEVHEFVAERLAEKRLSGGQVFMRVRSAMTMYAQRLGDRYLPTLQGLSSAMPWWLETLIDDPDARADAVRALEMAKAGR